MMQLTFVTGNQHKFDEISHLLAHSVPNCEVIQSKIPLSELQAETLEEVAKFKVNSVKKWVKPPYFIEDAGFFVQDVCNGFPGVYSSYVMKTIGNRGILKIMGGSKDRKACFRSVIAYMDEFYQVRIFSGVNDGNVAYDARGTSGFGFDPIFVSNDYPEKTFAELTIEEKNSISHRTRSMTQLIDFLNLKQK